jgi:hypothetical protein
MKQSGSRLARRAAVVAAVVAVVVVAAAFGIRAYMVWDRTRDVLPALSPVPDGPRAPRALHLLDVEPGRTTLDAVQAFTQARGWSCRDVSMRGLMQAGRAEARAKVDAAKAAGIDPDTVAGASRAHYYSRKERNPQIQWSCEDVDVTGLDDIAAGPADLHADVVFIFDAAALPLRSVMVSRKLMSQSAALALRDAALARFADLGAPHELVGAPDLTPGEKIFKRLRLVSSVWQWADRRVTVSVMNFGPAKGIDVREIVEIPWPITTAP